MTFTASPNYERFTKRLRSVTPALPSVIEGSIRDLTPSLLSTLRTYPPKPRYPLRWASDKQRRKVMALLREKGNLPYSRSGNVARAWRVETERNAEGNTVIAEVMNDVIGDEGQTYARYVYGDGDFKGNSIYPQQPFHQDTGWQPITPVIENWANEIHKDIANKTADYLLGGKYD